MFIQELTVFSLSYALSPLQVEWLLHTSRHICQKRTSLRGIAFLAAQCGCLYKHGCTTGFFRKCLGFCSWLSTVNKKAVVKRRCLVGVWWRWLSLTVKGQQSMSHLSHTNLANDVFTIPPPHLSSHWPHLFYQWNTQGLRWSFSRCLPKSWIPSSHSSSTTNSWVGSIVNPFIKH